MAVPASETLPAGLDPEGVLTVVYRAIGKLTAGNARPTSCTDRVELDEAIDDGEELVRLEIWSEFYVKTIYRRRFVRRD